MANNNSSEKRVNLFQKIVFQNTAVNVVMLVLFLITIIIAKNSMQTLIYTSVMAGTNEVDLLL